MVSITLVQSTLASVHRGLNQVGSIPHGLSPPGLSPPGLNPPGLNPPGTSRKLAAARRREVREISFSPLPRWGNFEASAATTTTALFGRQSVGWVCNFAIPPLLSLDFQGAAGGGGGGKGGRERSHERWCIFATTASVPRFPPSFLSRYSSSFAFGFSACNVPLRQ